MQPKSLTDFWNQKSTHNGWVVFGTVFFVLLPLLAFLVKYRNESDLTDRARALSLAYRERILSSDIQSVEQSAGSLLKQSESCKVLNPNYEPLFDRNFQASLLAKDCSKAICWDFLSWKVTANSPIYFGSDSGELFGFSQLRSTVQVDWLLLAILITGIGGVLVFQIYCFKKLSKKSSAQIKTLVNNWTKQLREDPRRVETIETPFSEFESLSVALMSLGEQINHFERNSELSTLKSLSHDLLAPLSHLAGYLALIEKDLRSGNPMDPAKVIPLNRSIERLKSLAVQLCRLGEERPLEMSKIKIASILEELSDNYSLTPGGGKISFDKKSSLEVRGSKEHFYRIFENLFSNAFEAGARQVSVEAFVETSGFKIRVIDDGGGINLARKEKIFEPGATTKKGSNFGLGLANVKKLCEELGLSITLGLDSRGTTFELGDVK